MPCRRSVALQGHHVTQARGNASRNPCFTMEKCGSRRANGEAMLRVKSLHIVFVISWFAGLFYLPRIFVNLALEKDPHAITRLLLMARKLYRFMTMLAIPAILFGLWLWLGF